MKLEAYAKNHATALYEVSHKFHQQESLMSFMEDFAKVIKISPELRSFIQSKKVKNLEKSKLLNQSFKDKSNSIFIEYINTIDIDFNLKLFRKIFKHFSLIYSSRMDIINVTAYVADLANSNSDEIKSILGHKLKKSLKFKIIEDPALIGGIKVRIGNKFLDSTIKSQLSEMKRSLIESKRN